MSKLIAEETKYMANPEGRSGRGLEYDEQSAAKVREFAKLIETINNQPKKFWKPYAGKTLYVCCSNDPIGVSTVTILWYNNNFAKVCAFAEKNRKPGAMILPVPSAKQLRQAMQGAKTGLFE